MTKLVKSAPFFLFTISIYLLLTTASDAGVECQIDNITYSNNAKPVPVNRVGIGLPDSNHSVHAYGATAEARYSVATRFEPQSFLMMTLNDVTSVIYDVKEDHTKILNIMSTGDVRFQCYVNVEH